MKQIAGLVIAGFFFLAISMKADTLFNGKVVIAFGHGAAQGHKIHWSDCSGQNAQDYDAPPYWLDKANNCELGPGDIGVQVLDGKFIIKDEKKFQQFFPDAKAGDTVSFRVMPKSVEIIYKGKTMTARK